MTLANRLAEERRARLAAERLLELKQAELFAANRKLDRHARRLSVEITETRAEVATVRTENARVKNDLTAAHDKIATAERRLWQSIDAIQDGFAFFDENDCLLIANSAYLSVFDGLQEVAPGIAYPRILQLLTEEGIIDPGEDGQAQWRQSMLARWQSPQPEPMVVRLWNDRFIRLIDRRGLDGDVVSLALDITASVRSERRLRIARTRAESANRAKSAFLANMSHEIRTPMNGVISMAAMLADTGLNTEQALYVDTIRNSGEALLVIINDVLDYSKIEAGKLDLKIVPINLEDVVRDVVVLLQPGAQAKSLQLGLRYDPSLTNQFLGDAGRIRQVLMNLVGNALKFTHQGEVNVLVEGTPHRNGKTSVTIAVSDTGIGIPPDKIAYIFGEFKQVEDDRNRAFDGTGLGLAITQRLVHLMGGEICVTSEPEVGTCFTVTLLLETAPQIDPPAVQLPCDMRRVLVMGDDPQVIADLAQNLTSGGATQVTVPDASCYGVASIDADHDVFVMVARSTETDAIAFARSLRGRGIRALVVVMTDGVVDHADTALNLGVFPMALASLSGRDLLTELRELFLGHMRKTNPDHCVADASLVATSAPPATVDILLAEDNQTNQLVFTRMVANMNMVLRHANNGQEAVEQVRFKVPDLIFMDISMPIMDGIEATRRIRALPGGPTVPIIAVTAHAIEGDRQDIMGAGLDGYLTKPVRKSDIRDILEQFFPGVVSITA